MNSKLQPKITFGIIVLNGEPFTRYCLRSIYPFAYEIIVVEGGHEDAKSVCTSDGHSVDGTLEALYSFKLNEDKENKLTIITRDGFWPKKDELGRNRTPQSRAYAERATGDYLWQIDIDEFYKHDDMINIIQMLNEDSSITAVSFKQKSFWGGIDYISESYALLRNKGGWNRIFKWNLNYKYVTHEPPTVVDENGFDLHRKKWISGEKMSKRNIFMYHYSLLFPWQVEQKVRVYNDEAPQYHGIISWAENNYFKLSNPYRVHNLFRYPSWIIRFKGEHPKQIISMMYDIHEGKIDARVRPNEDIELLLSSKKYNLNKHLLLVYEPIDYLWNYFIFNLFRVKNIPGRLRRVFNHYKSKFETK